MWAQHKWAGMYTIVSNTHMLLIHTHILTYMFLTHAHTYMYTNMCVLVRIIMNCKRKIEYLRKLSICGTKILRKITISQNNFCSPFKHLRVLYFFFWGKNMWFKVKVYTETEFPQVSRVEYVLYSKDLSNSKLIIKQSVLSVALPFSMVTSAFTLSSY